MTHPSPPESTGSTGSTPTVASFLAARDEPCPRCGYNLRGVHAAACPECGTGLELALRRITPFAGYGLFLLLAFGWLFTAGTMNAVRSTRTMVQILRPPQFQTFFRVSSTTASPAIRVLSAIPATGTVSTQPATPSTSITPAAPSAGPPTVSTPSPGSSLIVSPTISNGSTVTFTSPMLSTYSGGPVLGAGSWSSIDANTWVRASWAYVLAIGGLIGLIVLAVRRRKGCSPALRTKLVRAAAALFIIYAGAHLYWFMIDIVGPW